MSDAVSREHRRLWESWNAEGGPHYPSEKVVQFTFRNFSPDSRALTRVLDLGCGSGVNTWFLAREGFPVIACDLSLTGLRNARQRLQRDGLQAGLVQCNGAWLPFRDATFDYVVCTRILELLSNPDDQDRLVAECSRVLRANGLGIALFASRLDYGYVHPELSPGPFFPPDDDQVARMFKPRFSRTNIDIYQTTYENGRLTEHNHLVTFVK